jgi:hypothetical protein
MPYVNPPIYDNFGVETAFFSKPQYCSPSVRFSKALIQNENLKPQLPSARISLGKPALPSSLCRSSSGSSGDRFKSYPPYWGFGISVRIPVPTLCQQPITCSGSEYEIIDIATFTRSRISAFYLRIRRGRGKGSYQCVAASNFPQRNQNRVSIEVQIAARSNSHIARHSGAISR